jgi:hypothetical protein
VFCVVRTACLAFAARARGRGAALAGPRGAFCRYYKLGLGTPCVSAPCSYAVQLCFTVVARMFLLPSTDVEDWGHLLVVASLVTVPVWKGRAVAATSLS